MTVPMIIALLVTAFMVWLIMTDKVPFGAAPLIACALMVLFGVTDIATAFRGFSNSSIVMLASFMVIIAALQKTRFIAAFKRAILRMASKGGYKAYVLIILVVMLGTSLFGTGSTAYYVMVLGLLSTIPSTEALPRSKFLMPAGFACNHPPDPRQHRPAVRLCHRRSGGRRRGHGRLPAQVRYREPLPLPGLPDLVPGGLQVHARQGRARDHRGRR